MLKVCGKAGFADDLKFPGMVRAMVVRSAIAHAGLNEVDTGPALRVAGVAAVLTVGDIPGRHRVASWSK